MTERGRHHRTTLIQESMSQETQAWGRMDLQEAPELSMVLKLQATVFQNSRATCPQICIPTVFEDRDILLHSLHEALPTARGCTPTRDTHARACTASIPTGTSRDPPATPLETRLLLIGRHAPPQEPCGHHFASSRGKEKHANTRVVALRQRLPLHAAANSGHVYIHTPRTHSPLAQAETVGTRGVRLIIPSPRPPGRFLPMCPPSLPSFSYSFPSSFFSSFLLSIHPFIPAPAPRPPSAYVPLYSSSSPL